MTATIRYCANDGTNIISATQSGRLHRKITLLHNTIEREGCVLKEWNTQKDGSGETYALGQTILLLGDMLLYAVWTKEENL